MIIVTSFSNLLIFPIKSNNFGVDLEIIDEFFSFIHLVPSLLIIRLVTQSYFLLE